MQFIIYGVFMKNRSDTKTNLIKAILTRTCCIFTPVIILMYSIGAIVSSNDKAFIPTLSTVLIIFAISFVVSLSVLLYKSPKLSFAAAHFINFIILGVFYYFVVVVMRNNTSSGGYTLVAMIVYIILFIFTTFCIIGTRTINKKKINDVKSYNSKFE